MTKVAYYEMCEALGSEPIAEEIPVEFDDLMLDIQEAMTVYGLLQDNWDTMNGNYLGKNYSGVVELLIIYEIDDKKSMFRLLRSIDDHRGNAIKANKPKTPSQ